MFKILSGIVSSALTGAVVVGIAMLMLSQPMPVKPVKLTSAQRMHDDKCLTLGGICPWEIPFN